ncbi:hypothetical protein GW17_00060609, partial [Ensete ventricosum]
RPPCPRAAPRWRKGTMAVSSACTGTALLRAGHGRCPCSLAAGKRRPLRADHGRALPLRPGRGQASPLAGWPRAGIASVALSWVSAAPCGLDGVTALVGGPGHVRPPLKGPSRD